LVDGLFEHSRDVEDRENPDEFSSIEGQVRFQRAVSNNSHGNESRVNQWRGGEEDSYQESASAQEISERVKPFLFTDSSSSPISERIANEFSTCPSKSRDGCNLYYSNIAFIQNEPDYYLQLGSRKERDDLTSNTDSK